jgi:hypothetical protein
MNKAHRALAVVGFAIGVLFLAFGLIFLCAASENVARLPTALVLLIIGAGLAAWAGLRWRRAQQLLPDVLDDRIVVFASGQDAELTLAQIVSGLDVPDDAARAALAHLEASGLCHQEQREGRSVYVFPGLRDSKVVRRCIYCGNEYSVREPLAKCPNCGGKLEIVQA